jgi:hypothetical protein
MSDSQSQIPALIKALALLHQPVRNAYKDVAFERAQVEAAYNAVEADRLKVLAGEMLGTSIKTHAEWAKVRGDSLSDLGYQGRPARKLPETYGENFKECLYGSWNETIQLRNALTAEAPAGDEPAPLEASIDTDL